MSFTAIFRALVLLAAGFAVTGCPAVLDDNFRTGSEEAGGTEGGGRGGHGATSGTTDGGEFTSAAAGEPTTTGVSGNGSGGNSSGGSGVGPGGVAGEAGAPTEAPCADCTPEECCEGKCVDLKLDANNCRNCGSGCPGTTCVDASCTNTCAQGFIDCNLNVVDGCEVNPAIDAQNCGNCTIKCGFGLECVEGYCVCPAGTADCDGVKDNGCETDTSSDKGSCGGCGKACSANQACSNGSCDCALGFADCNKAANDGCEASLQATSSCGSCALDCGLHGTCVAAGECGCLPGYLDCDAGVPGCETPATDPNHCGSCAVACAAPLPACDGVACNSGCGALTACGGSCVDTQQDAQNCGGCGKAVGLNQLCVAGKPVCVTGFANCDANASDCEVNVDTDAAHCGGCNTPCKAGALCAAGSCACAPTTPNDCGASCQQCCNATQCSDGDSCSTDTCSNGLCQAALDCPSGGNCCAGTGCFACCSDLDCTNGMVCSSNQCVTLTCSAPQIACDSKCINPNTDAANCGGCGNRCGVGRTCSGASCTPKWVATATPLAGFVAREKSAYAAMGSKVFIWGGNDAAGKNLADGAIYDPDTNSWAAVPGAGTPPTARVLATAVWTGSVVVVWGGGDSAENNDYTSGSRFDPLTASWQTITTVGAPVGRRGTYGFWTGSRVLFYGGIDRSDNAVLGASLYDPVNDKWETASTAGQPTARTDPTVGWSGSQLIVHAGRLNGGSPGSATYVYDLATNTWLLGTAGAAVRYGALGTWDGNYLLAWSGVGSQSLRNDGGLYDPVADKWSAVQTSGEPALRWAPNRSTGWSARIKPRVTLMVGGNGSSSYLTTGGIYNSTTNAWTAVSAWPSGASHLWGVGVWTGSELVVWGGRAGTNNTLTTLGDRYQP